MVSGVLWFQGFRGSSSSVVSGVLWFQGFRGSGSSMVSGFLWFQGFRGSGSSMVSGVLWFQGFRGSRGSVVSGVLWCQRFCGIRGSVVPGVPWFVAAAGAVWAQEGETEAGMLGGYGLGRGGPDSMVSPHSLGLTAALSHPCLPAASPRQTRLVALGWLGRTWGTMQLAKLRALIPRGWPVAVLRLRGARRWSRGCSL